MLNIKTNRDSGGTTASVEYEGSVHGVVNEVCAAIRSIHQIMHDQSPSDAACFKEAMRRCLAGEQTWELIGKQTQTEGVSDGADGSG